MSLNRYAAKRDRNEPEIITALEMVGAYVVQLSQPVDLLVGFRGRWTLLEVKDGSKTESRRRKTDIQAKFVRECEGRRLPVCVVTSPAEAWAAIRAVRV